MEHSHAMSFTTPSNTQALSQFLSLVHHEPLWDDIRHYLQTAAIQELNLSEHKVVIAALVGLILQRNWQRPGVATQVIL